ncbi:MAG: VWA domain-containing protein [Bacteroidia bacterium]
MKKIILPLSFLPFILAIAFAVKTYGAKLLSITPYQNETPAINPERPLLLKETALSDKKIQVALLLDISGSMDGLIEQAKAKLWRIVNELGDARIGGETPGLQIALYIYGGDHLNAENGYVKQVTPLTSDLDLISEKLFELTTNGGEEYCGKVIATSLDQLLWSNSSEDLKMIFIAGNEPFTQGPVNFRESCRKAVAKDIYVNTIFCGNYAEGVNTQWKEGAEIGLGQYMYIDHNQTVTYIATPYDDEISHLNDQLNQTYIYYGAQGQQMSVRQQAEDEKANSYSQSNKVTRAISKSKKVYSNESWDLVDASKDDEFSVEKIEKSTLPEEYKNLSNEDILAKVEEKNKERSAIQEKILSLEKERKTFIAEKQKEGAEEKTLDAVLVKTVREQASKKNYKFE